MPPMTRIDHLVAAASIPSHRSLRRRDPLAGLRPRSQQPQFFRAHPDRPRERRPAAPRLDVPDRRDRLLPGTAGDGGRDALPVHDAEQRRGARCAHRQAALDLHAQAAHGEDLRAALEPRARGLRRPRVRGDHGRAADRPGRQDGQGGLGQGGGPPGGGRDRDRLGAGGHPRREAGAGVEPPGLQDAAARRRRAGDRRRHRRGLRPPHRGRGGRPRRRRGGGDRGRLRPARLARGLRRQDRRRALALVRHPLGGLGGRVRRDGRRRHAAPPGHRRREGRRAGQPGRLARRRRLPLDDAGLRSRSGPDLPRDRQPGAAEFRPARGRGTTSTRCASSPST